MKKICSVLLMSIFAATGFSAQLQLPTVFTDHMVLQREQPVPVWGTADANSSVTVEFAGQIKTVTADADGKWKATLDPLTASSEPRILTVQSGAQQVSIQDVLVGEVWFCSGQSNMDFRFLNSSDWQATADQTDCFQIRLYETPKVASASPIEVQVALTNNPVHNEEARWKVSSPSSSEYFSAVALYFGLKLNADLNVPIGLIGASVGGSCIEAWTPPCGFASVDILSSYYEIAQNLPELSGDADENKKVPSALFNGMVAGHIPYAIRGAIWYQGESNIYDGMLYTDKTRALLNGWRELWGTDLPLYFVQIAPYQYGQEELEILPLFWEAQTKITEQIPGTEMAVINDTATLDNIHPANKKVPGTRLALLAEANLYNMNVVCNGPVFQTLEKMDGSLKVTFSSAAGLTTRDGNSPDWFEIAGSGGVYQPAQAVIQDDSVILSSPDIPHPVAMRFAWHELAMPNLVNEAGLPASAFRASAGLGQVVTVTDNFNRTVTAQTSASSPNLIGTNYTIVSGTWFCTNNTYLNASAAGIMIENTTQTLNSDGNSFSLKADVLAGGAGAGRSGGIVFNYQDINNYYELRYWVVAAGGECDVQLIKRANGVNNALDTYTATNVLAAATYYTLAVSSADSIFKFSLSTTNGSVLYSNSVADATFTDGYSGFSRDGGSATFRFDNYSLDATIAPKPSAGVTDSFEQSVAVQTSTSNPNLIGTNYTIISGSFSCSGTYLEAHDPAVSRMIDTRLQTLNTDGYRFKLTVDGLAEGVGSFKSGGLLYNYKDENNYGILRFWVIENGVNAVVQRVETVDGSVASIDSREYALNYGKYYTLSVSSFGNMTTCILSDSGTTIYSNSYLSVLSGGYAGFSLESGTSDFRFDNYSLDIFYPEQAPEPTPAPGPATMSFSAMAGAVVIHIGNLSNLSSVTNTLQARASLTSGTWTNLYSVTGVAATNWTLPIDDRQHFFRVRTTH